MTKNEDHTVPEHEAGVSCRQMNLDNKVEGERGQGCVRTSCSVRQAEKPTALGEPLARTAARVTFPRI